ncbi:gamma-aminobutyric acid type B receptor subunit 2 isoform X2 [Esox lucius]|uniref:gamma-aminobutyric acid type B receptor subunit 2 isoform X2 n=1 Tax=Esox lucius TaxID=8010 RepID=UPI001476BEB9|nr:gamma-aminobutyric acid type B receptor subunit 2 isoform X2 [Esox lucius]
MGGWVNLGQGMLLAWLLVVPGLSHVRHSLPVLWIMPLTNDPGGANLTASVLPAVELALDDLSRQQTNLRNYEINFHVIDSECDTAKGLKAFFDAICFGPKYLMIFGGVCSSVTSVIARSLRGWNLVQLSFAATAPVLDDEKKYPNLFRMVTTDHTVNQAVVKILQNYKWSHVGTLTQDIQRFSEIRSDLSKQLKKADVVVSITESLSADTCVNVKTFKDMDVRIIIGLFDENSASKVFCCAYILNMFVRRFQWILPVGYQEKWWEVANASNCSSDHLQMAMEGYIAVDFTPLSNSQKRGISGRTPQDYDENYNRMLLQKGLVASKFHGFAYDGVWVIAKVLTRVIESVRDRERYDIYRNFTISDKVIGRMVRDSMKKTKFEGVTGPVFFKHGERKRPIALSQFQEGREVKFGEYIAGAEVLKLLNYIIRFPGPEPPKDQKPSTRWGVICTVYIMLSVTTGLVMSMAFFFLFLLIKHRNHWVIKNSTPFTDYLIILGTILACSFVVLYGLDGSVLSDEVFETLCPIRAWTLSVGYDITFGALFAKTLRVCSIVKKEKKKKIINDDQLWIIIGGMLLIDFCLLLLWQIVDPLKQTVEELRFEAMPGDEDMAVRLFLEHCESSHMTTWLTILCGYKGFLTLLGCFLALRTRHADVCLCDDYDSKYTRLSVYSLTVMSGIGASGGFLPQYNPNVQVCLMALVVICCCICTLCLVFVPKLLKIRDNPNEVDPSIWFRCGPTKEDSESSSSPSSLDQGSRSFESLCNENQQLWRRVTEVS